MSNNNKKKQQNVFTFFSLKKYQPFPLVHKQLCTQANKTNENNFQEAGRPLTFVGKYKYSGLKGVSNSSHGKSVHTVYTTVGHSALLYQLNFY